MQISCGQVGHNPVSNSIKTMSRHHKEGVNFFCSCTQACIKLRWPLTALACYLIVLYVVWNSMTPVLADLFSYNVGQARIVGTWWWGFFCSVGWEIFFSWDGIRLWRLYCQEVITSRALHPPVISKELLDFVGRNYVTNQKKIQDCILMVSGILLLGKLLLGSLSTKDSSSDFLFCNRKFRFWGFFLRLLLLISPVLHTSWYVQM